MRVNKAEAEEKEEERGCCMYVLKPLMWFQLIIIKQIFLISIKLFRKVVLYNRLNEINGKLLYSAHSFDLILR